MLRYDLSLHLHAKIYRLSVLKKKRPGNFNSIGQYHSFSFFLQPRGYGMSLSSDSGLNLSAAVFQTLTDNTAKLPALHLRLSQNRARQKHI